MLTVNALESRSWEEFALGSAAAQSDIPREVMARLLHIHWTWQAPMFLWVYRPAFMRKPLILLVADLRGYDDRRTVLFPIPPHRSLRPLCSFRDRQADWRYAHLAG